MDPPTGSLRNVRQSPAFEGKGRGDSLEPLNQSDDGRLATSTRTDESRHLPRWEDSLEVEENLHTWPRGVDEVDGVDLDQSSNGLWLESEGRDRVNDGDAIDRREDGRRSSEGKGEGLEVGSDLREREGSDEDGEED